MPRDWLETAHDESLPMEERIRAILDHLFRPEDVDPWLDAPHPDLGNRTPRSVIAEGKGNAVYVMLTNALDGTPS